MLPSSSSHWSLLIGLTIYTEEQQDIHNMAAILALAQARMMFYMEAVDTAEKLGAGTNKKHKPQAEKVKHGTTEYSIKTNCKTIQTDQEVTTLN